MSTWTVYRGSCGCTIAIVADQLDATRPDDAAAAKRYAAALRAGDGLPFHAKVRPTSSACRWSLVCGHDCAAEHLDLAAPAAGTWRVLEQDPAVAELQAVTA